MGTNIRTAITIAQKATMETTNASCVKGGFPNLVFSNICSNEVLRSCSNVLPSTWLILVFPEENTPVLLEVFVAELLAMH